MDPLCLLVIVMLYILHIGLVMEIAFKVAADSVRHIVYLGVGVTRLHHRLVWHMLVTSPARGYQAVRHKLISAVLARRPGGRFSSGIGIGPEILRHGDKWSAPRAC